MFLKPYRAPRPQGIESLEADYILINELIII